jgi:serine/threonine protein phosphatase 1
MNYFILGDIHGCYFTFCKMLEHWDPLHETLISVGDLIDRGQHSAQTIQDCMLLSQKYPNTVFLKGNHEAELAEHLRSGYNENWIRQGGLKTLTDFIDKNISLPELSEWIQKMPLRFETETLLVTHAGVADNVHAFEENHNDSVLWNRKPLQNIGKLQIHGHTPLKTTQPAYNATSNSWNIDTGIYHGPYGLSGIKLDSTGTLLNTFFVPTDPRDLA